MATWTVDSAATELLSCDAQRRERASFAAEWPELDIATGYQVQQETLRRRLARGERIVGVKLGLTSRAKQRRMGLDTPLVAWLTDAMILPAGDPVPQHSLIHPRVEPELVFVMGERLTGPGMTAARALAAVELVCGGAELIDSRYTDFKFTGGDVVADNASSSFFVTGPVSMRPAELDLAHEAVLVESEGAIVDSATGAAIQGHPAEALALAVNSLAERGHAIEAGWIVLTGGMTDAVFAPPGSSTAFHFTHLGTVGIAGGAPAPAGTTAVGGS
jgi:2-oxo-3-hexenedioate decarboxylase